MDSTLRLRQINTGELAGFINQLVSGILANSGTLLASTGNLSGIFYPLLQNPAGYIQSGAFISQSDLDSAITQEQVWVGQNFYSLSNSSGFLTTGSPYALSTGAQSISGNKAFLGYLLGNPLTTAGQSTWAVNLAQGGFGQLTLTSTMPLVYSFAKYFDLANQNLSGNWTINGVDIGTGNGNGSGVSGNFYPSDSNPSGYLTTGSGDNRYYPLNGNPNGYVLGGINNTNSFGVQFVSPEVGTIMFYLGPRFDNPYYLQDWSKKTLIDFQTTQNSLNVPLISGFSIINPNSIDTFNRYLQNSAGITTVDWGNSLLNDQNGQTVDWASRQLFQYAPGGAGKATLDWNDLWMSGNWTMKSGSSLSVTGTGIFTSGIETPIINNTYFSGTYLSLADSIYSYRGVGIADFGNQYLFDGFGQYSIYWGYRYLTDTNGFTSVDWGDRQLYDINGYVSVDWNAYQLIGNNGQSWTVTGGSFTCGGVLNCNSGLVINGNPFPTGTFRPLVTGIYYSLPTGYVNTKIWNSETSPQNKYILSGFGVTLSGSRYLTTTGGGFSNLHFGDNIILTGNEQRIVMYVTNGGNTLKTIDPIQNTYNNFTGVIVYPNAIRSLDVDGNECGALSTNDGSWWAVTNDNSAVAGFWGRSSLYDSAWYMAVNGLGQFGISNANDNSARFAPPVVVLDPTSGNYYEAIRVFPYGNTKFKWGISGTDLTYCTVSGQNFVTGGPYALASATGNFVTTSQTGSFATTGANIILPTATGKPSGTYSLNWSGSNSFYYTISGNSTFNFTGVTNGQTIVVGIVNTGSYTASWPTGSGSPMLPAGVSGVKWQGGTAPTQTVSGTDIYTFVSLNNIIFGSAVQGF